MPKATLKLTKSIDRTAAEKPVSSRAARAQRDRDRLKSRSPAPQRPAAPRSTEEPFFGVASAAVAVVGAASGRGSFVHDALVPGAFV